MDYEKKLIIMIGVYLLILYLICCVISASYIFNILDEKNCSVLAGGIIIFCPIINAIYSIWVIFKYITEINCNSFIEDFKYYWKH